MAIITQAMNDYQSLLAVNECIIITQAMNDVSITISS